MIIIQTAVQEGDEVLDLIDEGVRALQAEGVEPRFVVVGAALYPALNDAIARRFGRGAGTFESYQWLSIVVDPFRGGEICVLPAAPAMAGGVRAEAR
jgi:hypothetical protein